MSWPWAAEERQKGARVFPVVATPKAGAAYSADGDDDEDGDRDDKLTLHEVWMQYERGSRKFFSAIEFAKDGGFSEVPSMFVPDRFVMASFQIGCVVLNLFFIIVPNVRRLMSHGIIQEILDVSSKRLLLNALFDASFDPGVLLAVLELSMLVMHLGRFALVLYYFFVGTSIDRWHSAAALLWHIVPSLGSFSALRLLMHVTPKVFAPNMQRQYKLAMSKKTYGRFCFFLARTAVCGIVGFEAFMVKFIFAAEGHKNAESWFEGLIVSAAFLNQLLGIIDVSKFAHKRLFTFIFAGEDSFLSLYEQKVSRTWRAMMAKHIWEASESYKFRIAWFLAVGLAYSDRDFQKLTLEPVSTCQMCNAHSQTGERADSGASPRRDGRGFDRICMLTPGCFRDRGHRGVCAVRDF